MSSDMTAYYDRNYNRADKNEHTGGWPTTPTKDWESRTATTEEDDEVQAVRQIIWWAVANKVDDISEILEMMGLV
jgi:hypothetical protein